jgi:hypothetical protein
MATHRSSPWPHQRPLIRNKLRESSVADPFGAAFYLDAAKNGLGISKGGILTKSYAGFGTK